MTLTATVVEVHPQTLVGNPSSPGGMRPRRPGRMKEQVYPVCNPDGLRLEPGDSVEVYLPPGATVLQGGAALLIPLAFFPIAFMLSARFIPGANDALSFFIGLGAVVAGFLVNAAIGRLGLFALPRLLRVLGSEGESQDGKDCTGCPVCN